MSIAYPLITISVTAVLALESYRVRIGSVWITGNLLFRAQSSGRDLLRGMERWARAVDAVGRGYVLYPADHPKAARLVIQPLDSRYCFEVFPAQLDMGPETAPEMEIQRSQGSEQQPRCRPAARSLNP
ncbi:MAG: hypothetical protein R6X27_04190 [Candidatus Desulfacyla sp.]